MNKSISLTLAFTLFSLFIFGQNTPATKANYELPARFSPKKMEKMVFSTSVQAHWLKNSTRFWYSYETTNGKNYYIVDPTKRSKNVLFDNVNMAAHYRA
jgi:hypothetical protein